MALFSGKIIEAHYIDTEYSIVEVLYTGDDGNLYSHALRVDPHNQEWLDLLAEGWNLDKLADGTAEYKRASSASFNSSVNSLAKELVKELLTKESETLSKLEEKALNKLNRLNELEYESRKSEIASTTDAYEHILSKNEDKDELFKFKLWALEQEIVKNADKDVKSSIRKVTKITEGFSILNNLLG
jgi:hypothetical protein